MVVHVRLFGVLREKLEPEAHGRTELDVRDGATIDDVLTLLGVSGHLHVSVNDDIVEDWQTMLAEGDCVDVFRPSAGGAPCGANP